MGLSRNKVAVSEGAAGSPPFYGESEFDHARREDGLVFGNSAGRKNRTETDLGGNYERGATRFVWIDLVVQFSMIDETIIETVKATLQWGCSSAGRAPALQAGGHGFDSHHLHQPTVWAKVIRISALE